MAGVTGADGLRRAGRRHPLHEGPGGGLEVVAGLEQRATHQQHHVGPVLTDHLLDAFGGHAAGRHRQGRPQPAPGPSQVAGHGLAVGGRVGEAAAVVGEDGGVRAGQAEQLAGDQGRGHAAARQGRMGQHPETSEVMVDQLGEGGQSDQHRCHQHHLDALLPGDAGLAGQAPRPAHQARRVAGRAPRRPVGGGDRRLAGGHPAGEGGAGLVGQAVVVLDQVDPAAGERGREAGELVGGEALGLQRRAGERPVRRSGQRPQPLDAEAGTGEVGQHGRFEVEVDQLDVGLEGAVAERHVQQLGQVGTHRQGGQIQAHAEQLGSDRLDGRHPGHDLVEDARLSDGVEGHLHALFDGQGLGPSLHVGGGGPDPVDGAQPVHQGFDATGRRDPPTSVGSSGSADGATADGGVAGTRWP